jgi:hypothetical protein
MSVYLIERTQPIQRPLTSYLVFTGEAVNPIRCSDCLTQKQQQEVVNANVGDALDFGACCRKCGLGLY